MSQITFTVYSKAEPQGSKKAWVVKGQACMIDSNQKPLRSYRGEVTQQAVYELAQAGLPRPFAAKHVPVELTIEFMFLKPDSVPKKRFWPVVKPDIDKLERATLDALTGVLFADDAQVVRVVKEKVYGPMEQVHISACTL